MGKRAKQSTVDPHVEDVGSASDSSMADLTDDSEQDVGKSKESLPLSKPPVDAPTPQRAVAKAKTKGAKKIKLEKEASDQASSSRAGAETESTKIMKLQGPQVHARAMFQPTCF